MLCYVTTSSCSSGSQCMYQSNAPASAITTCEHFVSCNSDNTKCVLSSGGTCTYNATGNYYTCPALDPGDPLVTTAAQTQQNRILRPWVVQDNKCCSTCTCWSTDTVAGCCSAYPTDGAGRRATCTWDGKNASSSTCDGP